MKGDPVWINGSLRGQIDPFDRGLTLGDGVFDTAVAFRGVPFAGERHVERLVGHAVEIGIPLDHVAVRQGWDAVLGATDEEHVILRTTVTRGPGGRSLWPGSDHAVTVMVSARPWHRQLLGQSRQLMTSTIARNPGSPSARLKTIGYLDNILAAREAAERGADDALLLTPAGDIACSTIANVFAIVGSALLTPPLSDGVLAGIMRGLVLESAREVSLQPDERSLTRADLLTAEGVFLTNSVRFLCPVVSLDGEVLRAKRADAMEKLTAAIAQQVKRECGFDPHEAP
jgi:branched-chain amino acid aminotransferase